MSLMQRWLNQWRAWRSRRSEREAKLRLVSFLHKSNAFDCGCAQCRGGGWYK